MALHITSNQGVFELNGNIVGKNAISLQHHFEHLLFTKDMVVLSVDHVKKIDSYGIQVLTSLYRRAMKNNKIFYIIGTENKRLQKAFGKVNYILRRDIM